MISTPIFNYFKFRHILIFGGNELVDQAVKNATEKSPDTAKVPFTDISTIYK